MQTVKLKKILIIVDYDQINESIEAFRTGFQLRSIFRQIGFDAYLFPNHAEKILHYFDKFSCVAYLISDKIYYKDNLYQYGLRYFLQKQRISYVGNSHKTVKISNNKVLTKKFLNSRKFYVPREFLKNTEKTSNFSDNFSKPCLLKPKRGCGSNGIEYFSSVKMAIEHINSMPERLQNKYFLEEYIDGLEITCWTFKVNNVIEAVPVKIIKNNLTFADRSIKLGLSNDPSASLKYEICEGPNFEDTDVICAMEAAKKIHFIMQAEYIIRTDMIVRNHLAYILEVNSMPRLYQWGNDQTQEELVNNKLINMIEQSTFSYLETYMGN